LSLVRIELHADNESYTLRVLDDQKGCAVVMGRDNLTAEDVARALNTLATIITDKIIDDDVVLSFSQE